MTTETYDKKPKFDPSKPFEPIGEKPAFDPKKPFEPVEKKSKVGGVPELKSPSPSIGTGEGGLVPLNVSDLDNMKAFVTGKTVEEIKATKQANMKPTAKITNAITQTKEQRPSDKSVNEEAEHKITQIADEDLTDPIKGINKLSKANPTNPKDILATEKAKEMLVGRMAQDGFDAKELLNRSFFGGAADDNQTSKILREKAADYDKSVAPLRNIQVDDLTGATPEYLDNALTPQIKNAAIQYGAQKDPQFAKELQAMGLDLNDPDLFGKVGSFKSGQWTQRFLQDENVGTFLNKENPALLPAIDRAYKQIRVDNQDYGINSVANEVSQEVQRSGFNNIDPVFNFYGDNHRAYADQVAKDLYKDDPQSLAIWNNHIRDNQDKYMDAPSLMQGFAEGGEGVFKGIANTFTEPFRNASESTKRRWDKEALNVSADPQGVFKIIRETGRVGGLVAAIAGTGNVLGAGGTGFYAQKIVPALSGGVLPFFGDSLEEGRAKYPDSPVKAGLSALVNTTMYAILSQQLFPAKSINQALGKVAPDIDNIVERLASGQISREAARQQANTAFKKALDFTGGSLGKAGKITAELTAIKQFNKGLDKIMMDDEEFKNYHPEKDESDETITLFLSNIALGGFSKFGDMKKRNRVAEESYYELASNPKKYERMIDNLSVDKSFGTIQEFKENLKFISGVKTELDALRINPKDQKRFIFEALKEKSAKETSESASDSSVQQKNKDVIKQAKEVKEKILAGEDAETIITESQQKEIDKRKETEIKLERLIKDNELENKKLDAQRAGLDGRNPDDKLKIEVIEENRKRANEDFKKESESLLPKNELLEKLRGKAGEEERFADMQYFIDKAGEAPAQYIEKYGPDITSELLAKVPTKKLLKNMVDAGKFSRNNPNIPLLEAEIQKREAQESSSTPMEATTEGAAENVVPSTLKDESIEIKNIAKEDGGINKLALNGAILKAPVLLSVNEKSVGESIGYLRQIANKVNDTELNDTVQYLEDAAKMVFAIKDMEGGKRNEFLSNSENFYADKKPPAELLARLDEWSKVLKANTEKGKAERLLRDQYQQVLAETKKRFVDEGQLPNRPKQIEQQTKTNRAGDVVPSTLKERSDVDIEKRMAELEDKHNGIPSNLKNEADAKEYNSLEKEMEKRERATVFNIPLEKINEAVDALMQKEKDKPNGFGVFIEKRDARETKEVADRYMKPKDITDREIKRDFKDALFGNPTTWYADGLKLRESMKEAANRGIDINELLKTVESQFTKDGFDEATARKVIAGILKPVFEGSQKVETDSSKQIEQQTKPIEQVNETQEAPKFSEQTSQTSIEPSEPNKAGSEASEGAGEPPISEPPKGGGVFSERPATELSHRGLQDVANEFSLPDVKTRDTKTDVQLRQDARETVNDWAEKGQYANKVDGLVKKAEGGEILTDKERVILEGHLANLSKELRDITDKKSPEFDAKLAEIARLKKAGEKTRSEAGAALRLPGGGSRPHPIVDYADAMVAKAEANSVDVLTEKQKAEVDAQVKMYEEKAKVAEDKLAAAEAKMAEMEAGKEIKKTVKSKDKTVKKKTADDYKKERESFKDELKAARKEHQDYLKEQGIHTAGLVSFTGKELKAVGKIVKSYADEIGDNLAEVTKKVFEEVKDYFDGITEKDVHDIIAGVYNPKQETKSELAAKMQNLSIEAKLINKLEELLSGQEPKNERAKIDRNKNIKELQDKIKGFRKEERESGKFYGESDAGNRRIEKLEDELTRLKERREKEPKDSVKKEISEKESKLKDQIAAERKAIKDEEKEANEFYKEETPADLKKLQAIKKANERRTSEIKERIANKDFADKPKPTSIFDNKEFQKKYPKLYNETLDAIKAKEDAQHEFDIALLKDQAAKRNWWARRGQNAKEVIATTKALKSGIDDSGVFVQNIMAMIAHPRSGVKAFFTHLTHFASEKRFDRFNSAIHNNKPLWDLMQKSGLQFTEPASLKQSQREEAFSNNALDKTFKIGGKSYNIGRYTTKPFERLFTTIGNAMRVNMFSRITQRWIDEGKTFETHPESYKSLATMLNTETGRGKLHDNVERASEIITAGIWSPRLMASRLNILGLSDLSSPITGKGYYKGLTPDVRKMAVADVAKFIGTGVALMGIAAVAGGKSDFDPESVTFGTVKIGNYTISVFDGFNKYVKTIVQGITGHRKIGGERVKYNRGDNALKFVRSSTTPAAGVTWDVVSGKDYNKQPVTPTGELINLAVPMSATGLVEPIKKDGMVGLLPGLGQFFGLNISDERDFEKKESTGTSKKQTKSQRKDQRKQTKQ